MEYLVKPQKSPKIESGLILFSCQLTLKKTAAKKSNGTRVINGKKKVKKRS